jgi:hypothetical protein
MGVSRFVFYKGTKAFVLLGVGNRLLPTSDMSKNKIIYRGNFPWLVYVLMFWKLRPKYTYSGKLYSVALYHLAFARHLQFSSRPNTSKIDQITLRSSYDLHVQLEKCQIMFAASNIPRDDQHVELGTFYGMWLLTWQLLGT